MCEAEQLVMEPHQRIVFTRTPAFVPPIYFAADMTELTRGRTLYELGPISNICADWGMVLGQGLLARRQVALDSRQLLAQDA